MVRKRGETGRRAKKQREYAFNEFKWIQARNNVRSNTSMGSANGGSYRTVYKSLGINDSMIQGVTLMKRDDVIEYLKEHDPNVLGDALHMLEQRGTNTFRYIESLQDVTRRLARNVALNQLVIERLLTELDRMGEGIGERGRKRWSQEEDELLIEMAARSDVTIIELSREFGRTPGAIQSRITHLVGINRLSKEVAGRFVGSLNGEHVEGDIVGTITTGKAAS